MINLQKITYLLNNTTTVKYCLSARGFSCTRNVGAYNKLEDEEKNDMYVATGHKHIKKEDVVGGQGFITKCQLSGGRAGKFYPDKVHELDDDDYDETYKPNREDMIMYEYYEEENNRRKSSSSSPLLSTLMHTVFGRKLITETKEVDGNKKEIRNIKSNRFYDTHLPSSIGDLEKAESEYKTKLKIKKMELENERNKKAKAEEIKAMDSVNKAMKGFFSGSGVSSANLTSDQRKENDTTIVHSIMMKEAKVANETDKNKGSTSSSNLLENNSKIDNKEKAVNLAKLKEKQRVALALEKEKEANVKLQKEKASKFRAEFKKIAATVKESNSKSGNSDNILFNETKQDGKLKMFIRFAIGKLFSIKKR